MEELELYFLGGKLCCESSHFKEVAVVVIEVAVVVVEETVGINVSGLVRVVAVVVIEVAVVILVAGLIEAVFVVHSLQGYESNSNQLWLL